MKYILKHNEWGKVSAAVLKLENSSLESRVGSVHPICT